MSSQDKMFPLVKQYYESSLSINVFCKKNKLSASTFRYWIQQYKRSDAADDQPTFVKVVETSPLSSSLEIVFPNKVSVRISSADLSLVKALINIY
jgi:transposase-like protein